MRRTAQPVEVSQVRGLRGRSPSALRRAVARASDLSPTQFTRTPTCYDFAEPEVVASGLSTARTAPALLETA